MALSVIVKYKRRGVPSWGLVRVGGVASIFLSFSKATSHSSDHLKFLSFFMHLNIGAEILPLCGMNLDKVAIFPVKRSTSLTDVGLFMLIMALHFSGLASIPRAEIMYPKNFPPVIPNEHLVGFNLMLRRCISANASSRFTQ